MKLTVKVNVKDSIFAAYLRSWEEEQALLKAWLNMKLKRLTLGTIIGEADWIGDYAKWIIDKREESSATSAAE